MIYVTLSSIDLRVRPISQWPGKRSRTAKRAGFRSGWRSTDRDLRQELNCLGATKAVLELEVSESDIRLDGWIRANSHPKGPGVILSFDSKHGPLRYPCNTYDNWQDNVRAIALAMRALRAVDRYGVTAHGEQYRGFRALPAPGGNNGFETVEEAALFVADYQCSVEQVLCDPEIRKRAYRHRATRLHPDKSTGNEEAFKKLQAAMELLECDNDR